MNACRLSWASDYIYRYLIWFLINSIDLMCVCAWGNLLKNGIRSKTIKYTNKMKDETGKAKVDMRIHEKNERKIQLQWMICLLHVECCQEQNESIVSYVNNNSRYKELVVISVQSKDSHLFLTHWKLYFIAHFLTSDFVRYLHKI